MDSITSQDVFQDILEHLHVAVYIMNVNQEVVYLNRAAERLEGLDRTRDLGLKFHDLWTSQPTDPTGVPILDSLLTGRSQYCTNLVWYTREGKYINAITSSYPIERNGQIVGSIALSEDVAGMKRHLIRQGAFERKRYNIPDKNHLKNGTEYTLDHIIGSSDRMKSAVAMARRFASKSFPVMIYGETGTGKEVFAQGIHNAGTFSKGQFVALNCAAIPENLLESLLFGTSKGAFTGATDREGYFEKAQNGTVFLDEINSMPIGLQAKLLRALQEKEVQRVGSSQTIKISCRIISATNKDPQLAVSQGELREDLYYRLSTGILRLPPLRGRHQDIEDLTNYFIAKCNEDMEMAIPGVSDALLQLFKMYKWPGNIRELSNVIANAVVMAGDDDLVLDFKHIPDFMVSRICENFFVSGNATTAQPMAIAHKAEPAPYIPEGDNLFQQVDAFEKKLILQAMEQGGGKATVAAKHLGISRQALYAKLRKHNIPNQI